MTVSYVNAVVGIKSKAFSITQINLHTEIPVTEVRRCTSVLNRLPKMIIDKSLQ